MIVHNVADRRGFHASIGSWYVKPLDYENLGAGDIGRTVIRTFGGKSEAGTLSSWRNGLVFVRYSSGKTAAATDPKELFLADGSPAK